MRKFRSQCKAIEVLLTVVLSSQTFFAFTNNMKIVHGDLLSMAQRGDFDVIIHGCNCFNTMGAGIAKSIKQNFPSAYKADCQTREGNPDKLGTYSSAEVFCHPRLPGQRGQSMHDESEIQYHKLTVVNAYTQYGWKPTIRTNRRGQRVHVMPVNYDAIRLAFRNIKQEFSGRRLGYPKIGAGLAGGNWDIIAMIIDEELRGEDHTLVVYQP
ncbi:Zn peptidase [Nitzschia inconspicua]|uniref:Zn peptidase n=1 Tax=Nitzschia inconspicua TaxID=303405 RepID=A0A9K3PGC9_9STRA|nr:Zn peptidase [Nitzschia inconspicua]